MDKVSSKLETETKKPENEQDDNDCPKHF